MVWLGSRTNRTRREAGAIYHVLNHGNGGTHLLHKDADFDALEAERNFILLPWSFDAEPSPLPSP